MWLDGPFDALLISGVDIRNTMADGVNFHGSVTNSVVEQSFLRNTGDDGLASWSDARGRSSNISSGGGGLASSYRGGGALEGAAGLSASPNAHNTFRANTVVLPILANHVALYGGADNAILRNLAIDSLTEGGAFHVGNRFTSVPASGVVTVSGNVAVRAGCVSGDYPANIGALWFFALEAPLDATVLVDSNELRDSSHSAVSFVSTHAFPITRVSITNTTIVRAAAFAFEVVATAGLVDVSGVVATGIGAAGGVNNCSVPLAFVEGAGNEGWGTRVCLPRGGGAA